MLLDMVAQKRVHYSGAGSGTGVQYVRIQTRGAALDRVGGFLPTDCGVTDEEIDFIVNFEGGSTAGDALRP